MRITVTICTILMIAAANQMHAQQPASSTDKGTNIRQTGTEVVAKLADQPMQIARTSDGRIFTVLFNSLSGKSRLVEVKKTDGSVLPYPNDAWNTGRQPDGSGFSEIVGLKAGENGWLGIIDAGSVSYSPRVIIWDTRNNAIVKIKEIDQIHRPAGAQRFVQDLAIDVPHKCIYSLAASKDRKSATVIVLDMGRDAVRTFTIWKGKEVGSPVIADKTELSDTASLRWGLNIPIAIDPSSTWVYMGGIGGQDIFRVKSEVLADPALTSDQLLRSVELYGTKPLTTHIAADDLGNVYCVEGNSKIIGLFSPDRQYRSFLQDQILNYPYDIALGGDGYLYISVNQIQRLNEKGKTTVDQNHPFLIARIPAKSQKPAAQ